MKIVILDRLSLGADTPFDCLYPLGEVVVYDSTAEEEICERCDGADVAIINKIKFKESVLSRCKTLRLICVFATGFDNVDLEAARHHGIAVCNVPGYSTDSVAQFTVATVLSLISHLREYNEFVISGEYTASGVPNRLVPVYHELAGKTWGIIGLGNIGMRVMAVAEAFGAKVIYSRHTQCDDKRFVDIDTLCRESDIISIHCPLNNESRELINNERIAQMKPSVILVNEARGAVIDEEAVARAVEEGRIGAFGSDVFSVEPFGEKHPFYRIMKHKNVLLTPHAAWGSYESRLRCINIIRENIDSFLTGKTLNRVDIIGQK